MEAMTKSTTKNSAFFDTAGPIAVRMMDLMKRPDATSSIKTLEEIGRVGLKNSNVLNDFGMKGAKSLLLATEKRVSEFGAHNAVLRAILFPSVRRNVERNLWDVKAGLTACGGQEPAVRFAMEKLNTSLNLFSTLKPKDALKLYGKDPVRLE